MEQIRAKINQIDSQILSLLNERTDIVLSLVETKKQQNLPIRDPEREAEVIQRLSQQNYGPMPDECLERIYKAIFDEMCLVQERAS